MSDHLFRGSMEDIDPSVYQLTQIEAERQFRKLILIPSRSEIPSTTTFADAPMAVPFPPRQAPTERAHQRG